MKDLRLEEVYIYLLERTIREIKREFNRMLKEAHPEITITSDQWVILKRISEQDAINQREVAAVTGKDPASITRTLDLLVKKGWVERQAMPDDRRAYLINLTEVGWDLVHKITPLAKETRQLGLKGISQEEYAAFSSVINKIYENVKEV